MSIRVFLCAPNCQQEEHQPCNYGDGYARQVIGTPLRSPSERRDVGGERGEVEGEGGEARKGVRGGSRG